MWYMYPECPIPGLATGAGVASSGKFPEFVLVAAELGTLETSHDGGGGGSVLFRPFNDGGVGGGWLGDTGTPITIGVELIGTVLKGVLPNCDMESGAELTAMLRAGVGTILGTVDKLTSVLPTLLGVGCSEPARRPLFRVRLRLS